MNYYSVLGIDPTATSEQIKTAYRKLARQHHPDSGGDAEKFKQVTEAYDVLKDAHKRAAFDHRSTRIHINAGDVFEDLHQAFAFRQRASQQRRNKNLSIEVEIDLEELGLDSSYVFSWCGKVHVNGLMYGNGGLKLWTRKFVHNMRTHENSVDGDARGKVEFCFDDKYYQFNDNYSTSYTNATAMQAWRAGFREGVKMALDQGNKVDDISKTWWQNLDRLKIWCSVGADVENGLWSIYGAREGLYKTMCTDWDFVNVRDFKWLNEYWDSKNIDEDQMEENTIDLGYKLIEELDLPIAAEPLDGNQSLFFKTVYMNPSRIPRKGR